MMTPQYGIQNEVIISYQKFSHHHIVIIQIAVLRNIQICKCNLSLSLSLSEIIRLTLLELGLSSGYVAP